MNTKRLKKLERISRELVSSFIVENLGDKEKIFWIITITEIKISTDLSYIDIYVSSITNGNILTKALKKYNFEIQRELNKNINIRKLPKVRFRYDNKWAIWQEVSETILKECSSFVK